MGKPHQAYRVVHISQTTRETDAGGVAKFGWYLQQATGCELHAPQCWTDPLQFNARLKDQGVFSGDVIAIVDGFWGRGIPPDVPIISVAHGTYATLFRRMGKNPNTFEVDWQHQMWNQPNVRIVPCAEHVKREIKIHHDVDTDPVILHGVDLTKFKPGPSPSKYIVLHTARSPEKRPDFISKVASDLPDYIKVEYLDAPKGTEHTAFQRGGIFLHASVYEGNSYACLEAMATNMSMVVSDVGLFEDLHYEVGTVMSRDASPKDYSHAIWKMAQRSLYYQPRLWMEDHASFVRFKKQWRDYIERVANDAFGISSSDGIQ